MAYKLGETIPNWDKSEPYIFNRPGMEGSCPPETPEGDNPSLSFNLSTPLPGQPDERVKDTQSDSDPFPAKPGA